MPPTISTENLHFATVSCNRPAESYERVHQRKQNVRLATAACHPKFQNVRFTTAACAKMYESSTGSPGQPAAYKNQHFIPQFRTSDQHEVTRGLRGRAQNLHVTTVLDIRSARNDERVARADSKFAFHHSFGRPMSTKWREGCFGDVQTLHFTTVLDVRQPRSDERVARADSKFAFHHSFGRPMSTKWREGCFGDVQTLHFTTVLDVRHHRPFNRIFWAGPIGFWEHLRASY